MKNDDIPCCAADAMRTVKSVEVNGATVGLSMLDLVFTEVRDLALTDNAALRAELLKCVKVYNYVPASAADAYAGAVYREYLQWSTNKGGVR
jgi:hypothetical protein